MNQKKIYDTVATISPHNIEMNDDRQGPASTVSSLEGTDGTEKSYAIICKTNFIISQYKQPRGMRH